MRAAPQKAHSIIVPLPAESGKVPKVRRAGFEESPVKPWEFAPGSSRGMMKALLAANALGSMVTYESL